jgi:uncharacterized protein
MDTRTGDIYQSLQAAPHSAVRYLMPMAVAPTAAQLRKGKVGRNDRCPCGSGKKFKACCLRRE